MRSWPQLSIYLTAVVSSLAVLAPLLFAVVYVGENDSFARIARAILVVALLYVIGKFLSALVMLGNFYLIPRYLYNFLSSPLYPAAGLTLGVAVVFSTRFLKRKKMIRG